MTSQLLHKLRPQSVGPIPPLSCQRLPQEMINSCNDCRVHLCVAIDFTSSNGYPYDPSSNHYYSQTSSLNDYEETIVTIGNALFASSSYRCHKSSIPVWGFGAKYDSTVRHIFQCGSTPTVDGVSGVLDAYQSVFQSDFIMSGPTIFTQVLQAAASKAKRFQDDNIDKRFQDDNIDKPFQYVVLLVITDGVMDNYNETLERLKAYHTVPLSVIFVGVGRNDFTKIINYAMTIAYRNETIKIKSCVQWSPLLNFINTNMIYFHWATSL